MQLSPIIRTSGEETKRQPDKLDTLLCVMYSQIEMLKQYQNIVHSDCRRLTSRLFSFSNKLVNEYGKLNMISE